MSHKFIYIYIGTLRRDYYCVNTCLVNFHMTFLYTLKPTYWDIAFIHLFLKAFYYYIAVYISIHSYFWILYALRFLVLLYCCAYFNFLILFVYAIIFVFSFRLLLYCGAYFNPLLLLDFLCSDIWSFIVLLCIFQLSYIIGLFMPSHIHFSLRRLSYCVAYFNWLLLTDFPRSGIEELLYCGAYSNWLLQLVNGLFALCYSSLL